MATIDYNSGNVSVYFFPSNNSKPVWFCDNNTGGIQIATDGSTPIPNTIQIGHSSSFIKLNGEVDFGTEIKVGPVNGAVTTINPDALTLKTSPSSDVNTTITIAEVRTSDSTSDCWLNPTEINISSDSKKITIKEDGIHSSGLLLNMQGGYLNVSGSNVRSPSAGGFNSEYLTILVNGTPYKIALHDV
jgi:hypothetical protein